jgi:DNA-binding GntR family transcriptional regulator
MSDQSVQIKEWGRSPDRAQRIAADLGKEILEGKHKQWDTLPTEISLVKRYSVDRTTIGKAKKLLGEAGFLRKTASKRWVVA